MKRWRHRCVDDPVPFGTAAKIEQHDGHGVIRSGLGCELNTVQIKPGIEL